MTPEAIQFIKQNYLYNPATGTIARAGNDVLGVFQHRGYMRLAFTVGGKQFKPMAHRAAWLLYFSEWPSLHIDHANGNKSDNRISNLRLATVQQNMRNTGPKKNSKLGIKGVRETPQGTYQARITIDRQERYLGTFDTAEEAKAAFAKAALEAHGSFAHSCLEEFQESFAGASE